MAEGAAWWQPVWLAVATLVCGVLGLVLWLRRDVRGRPRLTCARVPRASPTGSAIALAKKCTLRSLCRNTTICWRAIVFSSAVVPSRGHVSFGASRDWGKCTDVSLIDSGYSPCGETRRTGGGQRQAASVGVGLAQHQHCGPAKHDDARDQLQLQRLHPQDDHRLITHSSASTPVIT